MASYLVPHQGPPSGSGMLPCTWWNQFPKKTLVEHLGEVELP